MAETLQSWKRDSDLAGVRESEPLAKLPADERKAWQTLWAGVDSLLRRLSAPKGIDTTLDQSRSARVSYLMLGSQPVLRIGILNPNLQQPRTPTPLNRELLVLRHYKQMTNGNAAAALGLDKSAASKRCTRALEPLKELLAALTGESREGSP